MQEIIEHFVLGVLDENPDMIKILKEVSKAKKSKSIRRISAVEYDAIYDAIQGDG
jgi:hypothetical protein